MSAGIRIRIMSTTAVIALLFVLAFPVVVMSAPAGEDATAVRRLVDDADYNLKKGRFEDALGSVDAALERDPQNIAAHQIRAEIASLWREEYNTGKLEESRKALTEQKAQIPEIALFMEQINAGKTGDAIKSIREVIAKNPGTSRRSLYHYILSRAYAKKGDANLAVTELRDAIGWDMYFEQAYYDLTNIFVQTGNMELADRFSGILLNSDINNYEWRLLRAAVQVRADRTAVARTFANQVINVIEDREKGKDIALAYYVLASASYREYEMLPAKEKMEEVLKDAGESVAKSRQETDAEKKIAFLEEAFGKIRAYVYNADIVRGAAQKTAEARDSKDADQKAALAKEAEDMLEKSLADLLGQKDNLLNGFLEYAEKAVSADERLAEPHALMAQYHARKGEMDKAAERYEKYLAIRKDAQNYRYVLGLIRAVEGKTDAAMSVFAEIKDDNGEKHELACMGEALLAGLEGKADAVKENIEALTALREKGDRGGWPMAKLILAHALCALNKPEDAAPHIKAGASSLGGLVVKEDTDYAALLGTTDAKLLGLLNFSMALASVGLNEQALVQCRNFLAGAPDSVAGKFYEFMLLLSRPDGFGEAEQKLDGLKKAFEEKDKNNVTPNLAAASLYSARMSAEADADKLDELQGMAIDEYEAARGKDPAFGSAYLYLARAYMQRGQTYKAKEIVEEGLKNDVGNLSLLDMQMNLMKVDKPRPTPQKYIEAYDAFNTKTASSPGKDIDQEAGIMALAGYYRQLGRANEARANYERVRDKIEQMEDAAERDKKRKQYVAAYMALRDQSMAESRVEDARKYNEELRNIQKDFPSTDHFEGLCLLILNDDEGARAAFEKEIAIGRLNMANAAARAGLALLELKKAKPNILTVHQHVEDAMNLVDRIRKSEELFGGQVTGVIKTGAYFSFINVCAFLAEGNSKSTSNAADLLNRIPILFPGAEGWNVAETSAFRGINLLQVIRGWKTAGNFYDLAVGAYYLSQGLFAKAAEHMKNELNVNRDNFIALYFAATAEMSLDNEQNAIDHLKECQQKEGGKFTPAYSMLLGIYLRRDLKPHNDIQSIFEKMCNIDPRFRFDFARYYEQFYEGGPDDPNKKYRLALEQYDVLSKEKDLPERWSALNSAAWIRCEYLDQDKEQLAQAEQQVRDAIELFKKTSPPAPLELTPQGRNYMVTLATITDTYAWILYKQGRLAGGDKAGCEKAVEIFDECIKNLVFDATQRAIPVVLYHQAVVYDALRNLDREKADIYKGKAIDVLRKAVTYQDFEEKIEADKLLIKLQTNP